MKKLFLLITCIGFSLYLTGCAKYTPENTEHDDVITEDKLDRFLETKTENYYITTTTNSLTVEYLVDGLLIKEVSTDTIQETINYTDINVEDATIYAMYELNNDNYEKYLSENLNYVVTLDLEQINFDDFNLTGEVYKLKSTFDYGVEDLMVELNESNDLFEFKYKIDGTEYISTYKMTEDIIELPDYTYNIENEDAIKSFYSDFSTATTYYADGYYMHSMHKNSNSYLKYPTDDTLIASIAILEYYDDRTFDILVLRGWNDDVTFLPYYYLLHNIFKLEDEETFMKRFDNSIYDETDNSYTSIQNGNIMKYTFDFEEKTLNIYDGSAILIEKNFECNYSRLNDETIDFDIPRSLYTNLIK